MDKKSEIQKKHHFIELKGAHQLFEDQIKKVESIILKIQKKISEEKDEIKRSHSEKLISKLLEELSTLKTIKQDAKKKRDDLNM